MVNSGFIDCFVQYGDTPAHYACVMGRLEFLKMLVVRNSIEDINVQNADGESLVHRASRYGHADVVAYLACIGANCTLLNRYSKPPVAYCNGKRQLIDVFEALKKE